MNVDWSGVARRAAGAAKGRGSHEYHRAPGEPVDPILKGVVGTVGYAIIVAWLALAVNIWLAAIVGIFALRRLALSAPERQGPWIPPMPVFPAATPLLERAEPMPEVPAQVTIYVDHRAADGTIEVSTVSHPSGEIVSHTCKNYSALDRYLAKLEARLIEDEIPWRYDHGL